MEWWTTMLYNDVIIKDVAHTVCMYANKEYIDDK